MRRGRRGLTIALTTAMASSIPAVCIADCNYEALTSITSHDGRLMAIVREVTCSGPGFATTAVTDNVYILHSGMEATDANLVFVIDEHGHPNSRPMVRWISDSEIEIVVPNKSLIGFSKETLEGVRIRVRYQPDNPQEREAWLRSLGIFRKPDK